MAVPVLIDPHESVHFVTNYIQQFNAACASLPKSKPSTRSGVTWQLPTGTIIKLNFDVSVHNDPPFMGIGVVARDRHGKVLAWRRRKISYIQVPEIGEALAVRQAVLLARDLQLSDICIEGDCLSIILALNRNSPDFSASGVILEDINLLLASFNSVSFEFVPRLGNALAHNLSRNIVEDCDGGDILPFD